MSGVKSASNYKLSSPASYASDSDDDPNDAAFRSPPHPTQHRPTTRHDSGTVPAPEDSFGDAESSFEREADTALRISNRTVNRSKESHRINTNINENFTEVQKVASHDTCASSDIPATAGANLAPKKRRGEIFDCVLIYSTQKPKRPKIENAQDILNLTDTPVSALSLMSNSIAEEDYKKMKLWENTKAKKKKNNPVLLPETIRSRIRHIGFDIQEQYFTIDKLTREVMVTRAFMSNVYGGSSQEAFPQIGKEKLKEHGMDDFMFMNTGFQPQAPEVPGAPGLWFNPNGSDDLLGRFRAFTKINSEKPNNKWLYVGQYDVCLANPSRLSMQEWRAQPVTLQNTWADAIAYKGWGNWVCARILARKLYGTEEPDDDECKELMRSGRHREITADEVKAAYYSGKELMVVWTMKCIGYDNKFQQEISERYPNWVPEPPKKRKGKVLQELDEESDA